MTASTSRSGRTAISEFTSPLTIPGGAVAGAEIVRELAPDVALSVWQTLRSVLMWAAEEPAARGDLFEPCAMAEWELELLEATWDPDVRFPLAVLVGELGDPMRAQPERLARACLCVTDWALARNAVSTALGYAEAAALCWPDHPRYAWMVGRLMRTHGRLREAEQWIKRTVRVAANTGDWDAQTLGLNSLGNTYADVGSYRQAYSSHTQALRIARKHSLREREGEVLHDLFVTACSLGDLDAAEGFARDTLEIYHSGHPRLPALAHDVAVLWMDRGQFGRALPVFVALAEHFTDFSDQVLNAASASRAAAACGDGEVHAWFAGVVLALADENPVGRNVPRALYQVGLGAWTLDQWPMAEDFLTRAESSARGRGEADVLLLAASALDAVRERKPAEAAPSQPARVKPDRETLPGRFVATIKGASLALAEAH